MGSPLQNSFREARDGVVIVPPFERDGRWEAAASGVSRVGSVVVFAAGWSVG